MLAGQLFVKVSNKGPYQATAHAKKGQASSYQRLGDSEFMAWLKLPIASFPRAPQSKSHSHAFPALSRGRKKKHIELLEGKLLFLLLFCLSEPIDGIYSF